MLPLDHEYLITQEALNHAPTLQVSQVKVTEDIIPTQLNFDCVKSNYAFSRAKVPGGWLIISNLKNGQPVFIVDPEHKWRLDPC